MNIKGLRNLIDEKVQLVDDLKRKRNHCSTFSYTAIEKEKNTIVKPEYDFGQLTDEIRDINVEICRLKKNLRIYNETICKNSSTIADNIFLLINLFFYIIRIFLQK